jgi:hypothetical protein
MYINKLTITPVHMYCKPLVLNEPPESQATLLINDRLRCSQKPTKCRKKLPKILKDFVNPRSRVYPFSKNESF